MKLPSLPIVPSILAYVNCSISPMCCPVPALNQGLTDVFGGECFPVCLSFPFAEILKVIEIVDHCHTSFNTGKVWREEVSGGVQQQISGASATASTATAVSDDMRVLGRIENYRHKKLTVVKSFREPKKWD